MFRDTNSILEFDAVPRFWPIRLSLHVRCIINNERGNRFLQKRGFNIPTGYSSNALYTDVTIPVPICPSRVFIPANFLTVFWPSKKTIWCCNLYLPALNIQSINWYTQIFEVFHFPAVFHASFQKSLILQERFLSIYIPLASSGHNSLHNVEFCFVNSEVWHPLIISRQFSFTILQSPVYVDLNI